MYHFRVRFWKAVQKLLKGRDERTRVDSGRESMAGELLETKGETAILDAPFMPGG
jgi:hypothetical protein